jgi:hypothetical protein
LNCTTTAASGRVKKTAELALDTQTKIKGNAITDKITGAVAATTVKHHSRNTHSSFVKVSTCALFETSTAKQDK